MQGVLFKYGPGSTHVAFKSAATAQHVGCPGQQLHLVLVGGLTDGLMFAPYCQKLAAAVSDLGWSLVQAQLTSSYQGWGLSSLDQDAAELQLLSRCLAAQHACGAWVLMGHSTGCQDAVRYVQKYRADDQKLAGIILQAPVSDREYLSMYPSWAELVQRAEAMMQCGRGDEVLCRAHDFDGGAVTARRFLSLYCPSGDDDMFSTDLTLQQLQVILGPVKGLPCCILQSGADEAVPETVRNDGSTTELGRRMVRAVQLGPPGSTSQTALSVAAEVEGVSVSSDSSSDDSSAVELHVIDGAGHACAGHEDQVVRLVCQFLQRVRLPLQDAGN